METASEFIGQVWCEECSGEGQDEVMESVHAGGATLRVGTLKVPLVCGGCRRQLVCGEYAEALTFHGLGRSYAAWEEYYLIVTGGTSSGAGTHQEDVTRLIPHSTAT